MNSAQTETSGVVALLEQSCPGIARAMIGPMLPTIHEAGTTRCLAVTQDGSFAACWKIDEEIGYHL